MRTTVLPDHPIIASLLRTGHPFGRAESPNPRCPVCGCECESYYTLHGSRVVLGCDVCIDRLSADPAEWEDDDHV